MQDTEVGRWEGDVTKRKGESTKQKSSQSVYCHMHGKINMFPNLILLLPYTMRQAIKSRQQKQESKSKNQNNTQNY